MLSDTNIRQELSKRQKEPTKGISIDPFEEKRLTPVGYDLRVGNKGFSWKRRSVIDIKSEGSIRIDPNDTVIIETLESISLSRELSGTVHSTVSLSIPKGLSHISTTVDPGWVGKLLVSVHNFYDIPTELQYEDKLCTICFYRADSRATKDVGNQADREDIWNQLLDIAREQKRNSEREREQEKNRKKRENTLRIISLVLLIILASSSGILISFRDPALGAAVAGVFAVMAPVVLELLKPR